MMAHFDSSVHIKREHFEHFRPMKLEHVGNCNNRSSQPDYVCLGNGCFVCERAAIQAMPENANWKKKVQNSNVAYQMEHSPEETLCGGSFNLDSLRRLKPAESEKTNIKPFYIYDEKLGRKRRHDPWFAKHKVAKDDQSQSPPAAKRPDPKRKRMKIERDEMKQFQFQHAPFLLDRCTIMEQYSNKQFLSSSPVSSSPLSSPILSNAPSTTLQPATIQTSDGLSNVECNLSNDNNGDSCINDLMPLLRLNHIDFAHDANCNENSLDDNATLELDGNFGASTGNAHGLDEYEWIMGVLAE